jgi:hypothetical protein
MRAKCHSTPSENIDVPTRIVLLGASSDTITKSRSPPTSASALPSAFIQRFASTATNESRRAHASNFDTIFSASPKSIASALRYINLFAIFPTFSVYRCSFVAAAAVTGAAAQSRSAPQTRMDGSLLVSNSRGNAAALRACAPCARNATSSSSRVCTVSLGVPLPAADWLVQHRLEFARDLFCHRAPLGASSEPGNRPLVHKVAEFGAAGARRRGCGSRISCFALISGRHNTVVIVVCFAASRASAASRQRQQHPTTKTNKRASVQR